jgi:ribosomal protein S19E (S16A)
MAFHEALTSRNHRDRQSPPVSAKLTPYELRVLRSHRRQPLRESELERRRAALLNLSKLGYIELKDGVYRITPAGERALSELDR